MDDNNVYFPDYGAYVMVDGQYGSTGKGVLAAYMAKHAHDNDVEFDSVISNAGPNSGHTFYHGDEKHVLKQLPTFAVALYLLRGEDYSEDGVIPTPAILSAGAVIDPEILIAEALKYPHLPIYVHPIAACISYMDKEAEHRGTIAQVAGTRSGTGAAIARKIARDPSATFKWYYSMCMHQFPPNVTILPDDWRAIQPGAFHRVFVEVSQGFSLGLNDAQFYPKVTSRECTVAQALADARISPKRLAGVFMAVRTFPIRVGDVDGYSSGDWYIDQDEIEWSEINQEPELTTVTKRPRRLFTFSKDQLVDALIANQPDVLFINFMNYLTGEQDMKLSNIVDEARNEANANFRTLFGWGPKSSDVVPF